jgi:hypothetical protein
MLFNKKTLNKHEITTTIIKRFNLSKENLWKSILKQNQDKLVKKKSNGFIIEFLLNIILIHLLRYFI